MPCYRKILAMSLSKRVLWTLTGVTLALLALHLTFQYLNLAFDQKQGQVFELSNRVDMDDEVALPTWFSQFLLLAVGAAALLTARLEAGGRRKAWKVIGVIAVLFSVDEVGSIHEFLLQSAHLVYYGEVAPTAILNAWWLVLPLVALVGAWFVWWLSRVLPKRTMKLFVLAGVVYLAGAVGFDLAANGFEKMTFMYDGVMAGTEEALEMLGTGLALYAVIDYLETHQPAKLKQLLSALSGRP